MVVVPATVDCNKTYSAVQKFCNYSKYVFKWSLVVSCVRAYCG